MKIKTILKTIGWFVGWLVSFQLIGVGTYLMNTPSNLAFTAGIVSFIAVALLALFCVHRFTQTATQLVNEYFKNKYKQLNN